jgi:hypothetical protein
MSPMDDGLRNRLNTFTDIQESRISSYFAYLRTITTISTGLLALLVALKPDEIQTGSPQYLFLATISLLGLGILSSAITQFSEVAYLKQKTKSQRKMIGEYAQKKVGSSFQVESMPTPLVYRISEVATFVCLGLSIVTLIGYVFASELK